VNDHDHVLLAGVGSGQSLLQMPILYGLDRYEYVTDSLHSFGRYFSLCLSRTPPAPAVLRDRRLYLRTTRKSEEATVKAIPEMVAAFFVTTLIVASKK
jgi:hypothetical protein